MKSLRSFASAALLCVPAVFPAFADEAGLLAEARKAAGILPPKLVAALNDEIEKSGPEGAVPVCKDMAPKMAKEVAASTGWQLKRVSLKARNEQRATPDAWEKAALDEFDRRAAAGEDPASLEKGELVQEGSARIYRYAKALPVQALCLNCHGAVEQLTPAVKARIGEHYPNDRATGYSTGQIRGAIIARKAL